MENTNQLKVGTTIKEEGVETLSDKKIYKKLVKAYQKRTFTWIIDTLHQLFEPDNFKSQPGTDVGDRIIEFMTKLFGQLDDKFGFGGELIQTRCYELYWLCHYEIMSMLKKEWLRDKFQEYNLKIDYKQTSTQLKQIRKDILTCIYDKLADEFRQINVPAFCRNGKEIKYRIADLLNLHHFHGINCSLFLEQMFRFGYDFNMESINSFRSIKSMFFDIIEMIRFDIAQKILSHPYVIHGYDLNDIILYVIEHSLNDRYMGGYNGAYTRGIGILLDTYRDLDINKLVKDNKYTVFGYILCRARGIHLSICEDYKKFGNVDGYASKNKSLYLYRILKHYMNIIMSCQQINQNKFLNYTLKNLQNALIYARYTRDIKPLRYILSISNTSLIPNGISIKDFICDNLDTDDLDLFEDVLKLFTTPKY